MKSVLASLLLLAVAASPASAQSPDSAPGVGWMMLDLSDLNERLESEGYRALPEGTPVQGWSALFPQEDARWGWGLTGLVWNLRGGDEVSLDGLYLGGVLDWTVRPLRAGRLSAGAAGGANWAQLAVRKGLALDFDAVLQPTRGQLSQVYRWGAWLAPYLQYELAVTGSDFLLRVWGGYLWTPWLSGWRQTSGFSNPFGLLAFAGPPADLGGPFLVVQTRLPL